MECNRSLHFRISSPRLCYQWDGLWGRGKDCGARSSSEGGERGEKEGLMVQRSGGGNSEKDGGEWGQEEK